ncbi:hypothetical protein Bbelb_304230 [Branchiostoma belcheri]|nr:hypothetical protein Bbelb_304230 [Branchiostoma belcheri]
MGTKHKKGLPCSYAARRVVPISISVALEPHNCARHNSRGLVRWVNPHKATGGDNIPSWLLSNFYEELAPVLCNSFNACLQQGLFPSQWKEELVVPVPKTPRTKGPEEFRRISLTSCIGKVFEVFLRDLLLQEHESPDP